jgi:hypothetical protein
MYEIVPGFAANCLMILLMNLVIGQKDQSVLKEFDDVVTEIRRMGLASPLSLGDPRATRQKLVWATARRSAVIADQKTRLEQDFQNCGVCLSALIL